MKPREAGRELDIEICERVFGLKRRDFISDSGTHYAAPGEEVYWRGQMFRPSKDIAAAWKVAVKMNIGITPDGDGRYLAMVRLYDKTWMSPWFWTPSHPKCPVAFADTAPLAICLAALKAVEKERP